MYSAFKALPHISYNYKTIEFVGFGHLVSGTILSVNNSPLYLSGERLLFAAQGRVDNIDKLTKDLGAEFKNSSDSTLLLQAYIKWGKDFVHYLRGDWSIVVFNCNTEELFIAQSPTGYTSIYYYQDDTGFYFSSSIKGILQLPNYSKQLNETHFMRQLTLWDRNKCEKDTFYSNIFSLPLAHSITVKNRILSIERYWQPQNIAKRTYKNKQDYADKMTELFTTAVKVRLCSHRPVASTLSGGLDSSTVSYIAAELLKSQQKKLATFSHVPLFTSDMAGDIEKKKSILDETPLIEEVVRASGNIRPTLLNSSGYSVLNGLKDFLHIYDAPIHGASNAFWFLDIYKQAKEAGIGVMLTGEGGNGSISFAGAHYMLPPNLSGFLHSPLWFMRNHIIKPVAKSLFADYISKRSYNRNDLKKYALNIFAQPSMLEKFGIGATIPENTQPLKLNSRDINQDKELFLHLYNTRSLVGAACGHHYGIELRDPTVDQDVMEYFFSIPNEAFFDDRHNNRMLVKRMMRGKIPDSVLFEKRKGLQSADIAYRVKAQSDEITATIDMINRSAAANHYINTRELAKTWLSYSKESYIQPYQMQRLLKALQFALFLQINFD